MKKEDKGQIIAQLAETIQAYPHFYLVDVTALDAAATSELRRKCFKQEVKMVVAKNTLLQKALESLEADFSPLYGTFCSSNAFFMPSCDGLAITPILFDVTTSSHPVFSHIITGLESIIDSYSLLGAA